jgi:diadenosine tetraphosphate (Ap4A) HIT family hydrolase
MDTKICPFCRENGKVDVVYDGTGCYAVKALDNNYEPIRNRYLIIPELHIESLSNLPKDWHESMMSLVNKIIGDSGKSYNLSCNVGKDAGQRVVHVHYWLIVRELEENTEAHQLGFNALLEKARNQVRESNSAFSDHILT